MKIISDSIKYVGVDDPEMDLFESQYHTPDGMCYNSYVILDEKVAIMDTVDIRKTDEWMDNVKAVLGNRTPDYVVVQHLEPDHSGSLAVLLKAYPDTTVVASHKAIQFIGQFFEGMEFKSMAVCEGDSLSLGKHNLTFVTAPMVHWPEVIVSYESTEQVLFSADGFGKFGVYEADADDWACEARRYYFNICGKYGNNVAALLKKASGLTINKILPLHGPILEGEMMAEALRLYTLWSHYEPEAEGILVAYASIHGGTKACAERFAEMLKEKGAKKVSLFDLCRDDMAEAIEDAFKFGKLVLAAASYDGDVFPPMHYFLHKLILKGYRNRKVGIIENGTWAPSAAKAMRALLAQMKDIEIVEPQVTIKSRMKSSDIPALEALSDAIVS